MIVEAKKYLFAIDGQIYETSDIGGIQEIDKDIDIEMRKKLIFDTAAQVAFIEASTAMCKHMQAKQGLHPNLMNIVKSMYEDEERLKFLYNTIDYYKERGYDILDIDAAKNKMLVKMFDASEEIPDAWNVDGTLKDKYKDIYNQSLTEMNFGV